MLAVIVMMETQQLWPSSLFFPSSGEALCLHLPTRWFFGEFSFCSGADQGCVWGGVKQPLAMGPGPQLWCFWAGPQGRDLQQRRCLEY